MANKSKPDEKKKKKTGVTINEKLLEILDEYLEEIDVSKRSKYIEKLIREDMKKRGKDVSIDF